MVCVESSSSNYTFRPSQGITVTIAIKVLGPQQIVIDGVELPALAPQQRRVLAILATRPGEVISRDDIMQMLWGSSSSKLLKGLQAYVSNIRSVLGISSISLVGAGYRLNVEPEQVDEFVFQRHVNQGHHELSRESYRSAVEEFAAALSIWHGGQPFDDLPNGDFVARRAGLLEARLGAQEGLLQAHLELARSSHEVGALVHQTSQSYAEAPRRERRAIDHARALVMTGRCAEALQVLQEFRTRAQADATEPSVEFMQFTERVKRRDPAVYSAAWGSTTDIPEYPLPHIARERDVRLAMSLLGGRSGGVLTITGPAGVGKTRLGAEVAARIIDDLPGGVVWLEPSVAINSEKILRTIAERMGVRSSNGNLRGDLARVLASRRTLVVIDEAPGREVTSAVASLLGAGPRLAVLVTCAEPLGLASEHVMTLAPFSRTPSLGPSAAARFVAALMVHMGVKDALTSTAHMMEELESRVAQTDGLPSQLEAVAFTMMAHDSIV